MNTRQTAFEILVQARKSSGYIDTILHRHFNSHHILPREKRFIQELVYGTVRMRRYLDFFIEQVYHGQFSKAEYAVQSLLRMGLYQMEFMDAVPSPVAIHETVELAKSLGKKKISGLINGVLRNIIRQKISLDQGLEDLPVTEKISVKYSHPEWLINRWMERFGEENTVALCEWNNQPQPVTVRVNTREVTVDDFLNRLEKNEIPFHQSEYLQEFFQVETGQKILQNVLFPAKSFAVQDQAAGLSASLIEPNPGDIVLDICAAPGGKTTYLMQRWNSDIKLSAYDVNKNRLEQVKQLVNQLGFSHISYQVTDASVFTFPEADWVLADVPCTGTGVLGKRVDARWHRSPEDIDRLATVQNQILNNVAKSVKPGGVVVYSTCTLEPEENRDIVNTFLKTHPDFRVKPLPEHIPWKLTDGQHGLMILPQLHHMDGAFAIRLERIIP